MQELDQRQREQIRAELLADILAEHAYVAKHGCFADMVREHYGDAFGPAPGDGPARRSRIS